MKEKREKTRQKNEEYQLREVGKGIRPCWESEIWGGEAAGQAGVFPWSTGGEDVPLQLSLLSGFHISPAT